MIKVTVKYNRSIIRRLAVFKGLRGRFWRFKMAALLVLFAACVPGTVAYFTISSDNRLFSLCSSAVLFALSVPPQIFLTTCRALSEKQGICQDAVFGYSFGAAAMTLKHFNESGLPYDSIHRAYETGRDFILYPQRGRPYLLPKANFMEGTPEDLRALLTEKLGKKFIVCK